MEISSNYKLTINLSSGIDRNFCYFDSIKKTAYFDEYPSKQIIFEYWCQKILKEF